MSVDQIPIGTFSFMTRLSQKALRLYDQKGLLVPEAKDPFTGYRYYTISQMKKAMKIKTLLFLGFSLEESSKLFNEESKGNYEYIDTCFREKIEEIQLEIKHLQRIVDALQGACENHGKAMELFKVFVTEPIIKEIPEMRVISKREKGIFDVTIGKLIEEIYACVSNPESQRNRVKITGPIMFLCHDEEYKETNYIPIFDWHFVGKFLYYENKFLCYEEEYKETYADIEVALPISGRISVEDPKMEIKTLPAIKAVSAVCVGPYNGIEFVYNRVLSFAKENNLEPFGPSRELHLNDPSEVPEEELLTEVQIQVREK